MRYLPLSNDDRRATLDASGLATVADRFIAIPAATCLLGPLPGLPMHMTKMAVEQKMGVLAKRNVAAGAMAFFIGAGTSRHHVP